MGLGNRRLPFHYIEPSFFGGLLDDPLLYVRIRPLRRAILFDCGQIAHLAKRVVKPVDTVFITHAHMDHIMGIPTLVRHHHASPRPMDIFGPPGIADRIYHLLNGFDWNLSEPTWFTLHVHEVHVERIFHYSFIGPQGFASRFDGEEPRVGKEIWLCRYVSVEAELLDHKIPVLAFRINERPHFAIDPRRLEQHGLVPGDWILDLKKSAWSGWLASPVIVPCRDGREIRYGSADEVARLYESIQEDLKPASIGYLCDVGRTADNVGRVGSFLKGVTLLCTECAFLASNADKARASFHFCTSDLNELLPQLSPEYLLPMHLSKSYLRRADELYKELCPPKGTNMLHLPIHVVPAPLTVSDVAGWLRPHVGNGPRNHR